MREMKDSYLPDGRLAQQDKLDTAARLGWRSGRVCHKVTVEADDIILCRYTIIPSW